MAGNEGFEGDHLGGGSFSQLLLADDDVVGLDMDQTFKFSSSSFSSDKRPKMLCFGNYPNEGEIVFTETTRTPPKSGVTCSDSSSASSGNNSSVSTLSKFNKKRNGSGEESVQCTSAITTAPVASHRTCKKTKSDNPTSTGNTKVRKEKLGERITTLQQLVSPFGKTDTASVLHEAMGYIRFLHEQVQVLCSPYLQRLPSSPHHPPVTEGGDNGGGETRKDLRSRGLCLVPLACTVHLASSNGADLWSPVMGNTVPSSSKQ